MKNIWGNFFLIGIISFIVFIFYFMLSQILNVRIIDNFENEQLKKENITEIEILQLSEVKKCIKDNSGSALKLISENKLNSNIEKLYTECTNYQMIRNLAYDASRFDFYREEFNKNNIKYDLTDRELDINFIYYF